MPDRSLPTSEPTVTTRRTVLRAAGLAGTDRGAAWLSSAPARSTARRGPASSAPATSADSAPATTSAPAKTPSASASKSASASASKPAAPSGPGVARSEVPVGGGVILDGADYVITQPSSGRFKAFSKICTHQSCPVTAVEGRTINCSCHGSKFSIKDGSVQNGPATRPLPEAEVTVAGDEVVVTA